MSRDGTWANGERRLAATSIGRCRGNRSWPPLRAAPSSRCARGELHSLNDRMETRQLRTQPRWEGELLHRSNSSGRERSHRRTVGRYYEECQSNARWRARSGSTRDVERGGARLRPQTHGVGDGPSRAKSFLALPD